MTMRDERTGTTDLLRDSRYHRAALAADPKTKSLEEAVRLAESDLRKHRADRDETEEDRAAKLALLIRTEFELDERLRRCEGDVLASLNQERGNGIYKAAFPDGLSGLLAHRGDDEARAARNLAKVLGDQLPGVAKAHEDDLIDLADLLSASEKAWRQAEVDAGLARSGEAVARINLVRQLRKNESALLSLFPGQRRRVRSFFRSATQSGRAGGGERGGKPGA